MSKTKFYRIITIILIVFVVGYGNKTTDRKN